MTSTTMIIARPCLSPVRGGEGRGEGPNATTLAILLSLPAVLLYFSPSLASTFQFDRDPITAGQLWRLLTCHWTHWSLNHLLWDVAVFGALVLACATRCPRSLLPTIVLTALVIPATVWIAQPELATYRGLSGIDSALMVLLTVNVMSKPRGPRIACGTLLAAFAAKLVYELVTGGTVFVDAADAGFVPVPRAHVAGALVGASVAIIGRWRRG